MKRKEIIGWRCLWCICHIEGEKINSHFLQTWYWYVMFSINQSVTGME